LFAQRDGRHIQNGRLEPKMLRHFLASVS
jgi:hypothetical protein